MVLMCLQQKPGIRSHVALRYVGRDGRKLAAVTLALVQWQNEKQYSNEFDIVWEYDQKELLQSGTVVCMYMRHNMYQQRMEKLYPAFYNPVHNP